MKRKNISCLILTIFIIISFYIKLILIFRYKNLLTLCSDDLNYIKSAVILIKNSIFVYHELNEPTVFIMPLYPLFLACVFKFFGYGLIGIQMVRVIQAIFSCITVFMIFLIARNLFNTGIALISSFLVSFYLPNIITVGYLLTETLFTTLLYILIYFTIKSSSGPGIIKFAFLGIVWALITLCRPTILLYPVLILLYLYSYVKLNISDIVKLCSIMLISFILIMLPWWIRNYLEYAEFIPLTASSGNPMLQGTYIDYNQNPDNAVYYKLGKNSFETNKIEVAAAKKRISSEFRKDFWNYSRWYTVGKTCFFWGTVFYWREFFNIGQNFVLVFHYILLLGFAGIVILIFGNFLKYILPISIILYFNIIHCIYMAFDRYAFPVLPLLSIFCAFFIFKVFSVLINLFYDMTQQHII